MVVRDFPNDISQRVLDDTDHPFTETALAGHGFIVTRRKAHCFIIMSSASDRLVDIENLWEIFALVQDPIVDRFNAKVGDAPQSLEDRISSCFSCTSTVIVFKPRQGFY